MRALVVGGTGFAGSAVVRSFADRGIDVVSLSRSGGAFAGRGVRGDVRAHNLGLDPSEADELRTTVTHVVSCFGSVDWRSGPRLATELHRRGTRAVMSFAEACPSLERFVHLSSVLALGRASGPITDELELGQSFRNWYEYGKYLAEREVRGNDRLPWRALRVGPVLGPGRDVPPDTSHGILAIVPYLVRGYPIHLTDHGRFPSYACDATTAGEVIARAALEDGGHDVWTWFDDANPSLADVLVRLCDAWGVIPRITELAVLAPLGRVAIERLGAPRELLEYADPLPEIAPEVLSRLPGDLPRCPADYVEATSEALRRSRLSLRAA
jgi:nucleoside-diphosphate-sugar epimerase